MMIPLLLTLELFWWL